ncbi:Regulatory protein cys-3 [Escovopsis weberi]|uniref:Regulatory protein cys-3 n=1 Tax=Escovopsis weberi TaxID=150374 RepID=A0A0M8N044_ESCWE|nr:Regulatory protein cys-3 [Escovopsis weberi]
MSNYNGRHGPNVSQYLRDLNTTIHPQEAAAACASASAVEENFNMDDELALFTNTQFFDFDSGQNTDFQAQPVKPDVKGLGGAAADSVGKMPNLDFMPDFAFPDFNNAYAAPHMTAFPDNAGVQSFSSMPPAHGHLPLSPQQAHYHQAAAPPIGDAHKHERSLEDASRMAAEEDKRRRNTAASARFRIKKKQREQALEKSAKEMSDKVAALESKVSQLETENKWLKNLLVEKNEGSEDIVALWKEFTQHASKRTEAKPTSEGVKDEQ